MVEEQVQISFGKLGKGNHVAGFPFGLWSDARFPLLLNGNRNLREGQLRIQFASNGYRQIGVWILKDPNQKQGDEAHILLTAYRGAPPIYLICADYESASLCLDRIQK